MLLPGNWFETTDATAPATVGRRFCVAAIFAVLVSCLTMQEFTSPGTLPLKSTTIATVPLYNSWTIGWNAIQLQNGFQDYWDAPVFFPSKNAFAFSEPQPATMLVAPVIWTTGSIELAYKTWLFLSLFFNGGMTAWLLRRLGYGAFYQVVGGSAMIMLPIAHQQIDVLQLVPIWGILWFWSCLFQLHKSPSLRTGLETGVSFGICFALCVHHALFMSLLIPCTAIVFVSGLRRKNFLMTSLLAVVIGAVLALPIILPIRAASRDNDFERNESLVGRLSARPVHYVASSPRSLFRISRFKADPNRRVCVGWTRIVLAVAGIGFGLVCGRRRRWVLFLLLTAAFAFAFSQGPLLQMGSWKPWLTLTQYVPGFSQVRNAFRFVWFVQIAVVLLAMEGLIACQAIRQRYFSSWPNVAAIFLTLIPGVLVAAEVWPEPCQRGGVPHTGRNLGWIEFVRDNTPSGGSIACIPFATGKQVTDYDITVRWMYYGLAHKVPMVNGYSGFFPGRYLTLRNLVNEQFPSALLFDRFAALDVELMVITRSFFDPKTVLSVVPAGHRPQLVYEDPVGVDVYRLLPTEGKAPADRFRQQP